MPEANAPIRVAVIDDDKRFRYIIRESLKVESDIKMCGEAETLEDARALLDKERPDVVVLDISIGGPDGGLEFLKEQDLSQKPVKYIILSAHHESDYSDKSFAAGAAGYVCKDKTVRCLAQAVRQVHQGNKYLSSAVRSSG